MIKIKKIKEWLTGRDCGFVRISPLEIKRSLDGRIFRHYFPVYYSGDIYNRPNIYKFYMAWEKEKIVALQYEDDSSKVVYCTVLDIELVGQGLPPSIKKNNGKDKED